MKTSIFLIFILISVFADSRSQPSGKEINGLYVLKDYQYFRPLFADIHRPQFYMRVYTNEAIKFSNTTSKGGDHLFWDVGYGGFFPMLGYNYKENAHSNSPQATGWALFIEASVHMLLDFDTPSSDVLNTDFRIGGGIASRLPSKLKNIAVRYKLFHESTHIGDEFTLYAVTDSIFRRYNVSYEMHEFFIALDRQSPLMNQRYATYWRGYVIGKFLTKDRVFDDFRDGSSSLALKLDGRSEFQIGGESFLSTGKPVPGEGQKIKDFVKSVFSPQYWVIAADVYRQHKYAVVNPQKVWSYNLVLGQIYGNYFNGTRTTKLLVNYYHGVNPHGQFRMFDLSYLGITYSIDF